MTKSIMKPRMVEPSNPFFQGNLVITGPGNVPDCQYVVMVVSVVRNRTFTGVVVGGNHTIGYMSGGFEQSAFVQYHGQVILES